ncbi:hypothetical protein LMG33818_000388 [Halomonadaceae bacterium LMG 33818]
MLLHPIRSFIRLRRRLWHLRHRHHVKDPLYRSIVVEEEIQWYVLITCIALTPIGLCLIVMKLQNSLSPLLSYIGFH